MLKRWILAVFILITLTTGAFPQGTDQVGSTKKPEPSVVGAGGEFTTQIYIDIPEFRDLPLDVFLSYNSSNIARGGVDNTVGLGWRLKAFSTIERKSLGGGVPTFDDGQDLYVLDGQELMACNDAAAINKWIGKYPLRYLTDQVNASCSAGGNFSTRVEGYLRIVYNSAANQFTATRKDGTQLIYKSISTLVGDTSLNGTDTWLVANRTRWLLTEIRDVQQNPNVVSYTYDFAPAGEGYVPRIKSISYAGYRVDFFYRTYASVGANTPLSATGTSITGRQMQLGAIQIYDGNTKIRAYQISSQTSALTKARLVTKVQEFGGDFVASGANITAGSAFPATDFSYSPDAVAFFDATAANTPSLTGKEFGDFVTVFDINRTGAESLLFKGITITSQIEKNGEFFPGPNEILMSGVYEVTPARQVVASPQNFSVCGVNNYNTIDGITFGQASSPNSGSLLSPGTIFSVLEKVKPIYFFGDNRESSNFYCAIQNVTGSSQKYGSDSQLNSLSYSLSVYKNGVTQAVSTSPALYSESIDSWPKVPKTRFANFDLDPEGEVTFGGALYDVENGVVSAGQNISGADKIGSTLLSQLISDESETYVSDFNGDGVDDIAFYDRFLALQPELNYMNSVLKDRGTYRRFDQPHANMPYFWFGPAPNFSMSSNSSAFAGYADMDGNGLTDIVYRITRYGSLEDAIVFFPATGRGFDSPVIIPLPGIQTSDISAHGTRIKDINADGLPDVIISDGYYYSGNLLKGQINSKVFVNTGTSFAQVPIAGSLNGLDGLLIATGDFDGDGLEDFAFKGTSGRILFGNGGIPNRMVSVKNTAGGTLSVGYAPSSRFGVNQMPGVQQVVGSLTRADGRGESAVTTYSYVGGRYDFINRQTLGYHTITAYLPAIAGETVGPVVVTTYLNDHIAEFGLLKSRVVTHAGATFSRTVNDFSVSKTGNGPYRAYKTSTRDAARYGNVLVETRDTKSLSLYGEALTHTEYGFTDNGADIDTADNRITTYAYTPNLSKYIVSKPTFERVQTGTISNVDRTTWLSANFFNYDGLGNGTPPSEGNITQVSEWTGNTASTSLRTKLKYTIGLSGNILSETDARNQTTWYGYDTSKYLFRISTTNALGQIETTGWDTRCQKAQTVTDINNLVTTVNYGVLCREYYRSLPTGNYEITRYLSFGNAAAQYIEKEAPSASNIAGSTLAKTQEYFDGNGLIYKTVMTGSTTAAADSSVTLQAYDERGNLAWQSHPLSSGAATGTPPANQRISFTYDPLNRPLSTVQADGAKNTTAYVNFQSPPTSKATGQQDAHCFDAESANTACGDIIRHYDAYDRKSMESVLGGPQFQKTYFAYDLLGRLTQVTDPQGSQYNYTYDAYGNRLTSNDPGLGNWTMVYDANGNLTQQTDAKNQLITFTYDALNRPTEKRVTGGSDGLQITSMTYDEPVAGYYNNGKLTRQTRGEHDIRYDYHKNGQVARETHKIGTRSFVFQKNYTVSGALLNQTLPDQPGSQGMAWVGQYQYDAASRLTGLGDGTNPSARIQNITYNLRNQPMTTIYGNGAKDIIVYDNARGWANSISSYEKNVISGFETQTYTRTATGRVSRVNTAAPQGDFDYSYDYSGRLLAAANFSGQSAYNQSFTYDKAGRMMSNSRVGTYTYTAARPFHAPKSITVFGQTSAVTYDANGNMTLGLGGKTMGYDGENRPLWVSFAGKRTCYVYAADGSRLKKVENLPANQNCATLPSNAETTAYFGGAEIRNFGQGTAEVILTYPHPSVRLTNGAVSYLHMDQLGSIRGITGADGLKDSRATYRPFGEQEQQVYDVTAPAETKGFVGERYDEDAGLQYLNARYYDPKLALFIQPDWFEVTKRGVGTNRYSYSFNDPVNKIDPGGNVNYNPGGSDSTGWKDDENGNSEYWSRNDKDSPDYLNEDRKVDTRQSYRNGALSKRTTYAKNNGAAASGDVIFDIVTGGGSLIGKMAVKAAVSALTRESIWSLAPVVRGRAAEKLMGQNLPSNFPTIDKVYNSVATSIKSIDLNAESYLVGKRLENLVKRQIDSVAGFTGKSYANTTVDFGTDFTSRALEIAIPHAGSAAQQTTLRNAISYGQQLGVQVTTKVLK